MTHAVGSWDFSRFYPSLDDEQPQADLAAARGELVPLAEAVDELRKAQPLYRLAELLSQIRHRATGIRELGWNLSVRAACALSQEGGNGKAQHLASRARALNVDLFKTLAPVEAFWLSLPQASFERLMAEPLLGEERFRLERLRALADQRLPVQGEQLVTGLDGAHPWGALYRDLAARLRVVLSGQSLGLAEAMSELESQDPDRRREAWQGIAQAWGREAETVAAILCAIQGWRLELLRQRGTVRRLEPLDLACHQGHIARTTLDTLMATAYEYRGLGQQLLTLMARRLGHERMPMADLQAPPPVPSRMHHTFAEAIGLIADAFARLDPEMGAFARMAAERGWIDIGPGAGRSSGAYCTKFARPAEPRVFVNFSGTPASVLTLAHELGHAWHNWLVRDLPLCQRAYPMTLAESASIMGETLVREALLARCDGDDERLAILWQASRSAVTFLLNIPVRFEFECALVAGRRRGSLDAAELDRLMTSSWQRWYQGTTRGADTRLWASKGHFANPALGFYNYPYLFGYLFSLGLLARREQWGASFVPRYRTLLRDSGVMSVETLARRHLDVSLDGPGFWRQSLGEVVRLVAEMARLCPAFGDPKQESINRQWQESSSLG
ncbi:M3 family oligoendopeptidase [Aeromonas schubertii]